MAAHPQPATGSVVRPNPALTFKSEIISAKLGGIDPAALQLRLTRGDMSRLKRNRDLSVGDIRFIDGQMRFMDVPVSEGDVAASALVILQS